MTIGSILVSEGRGAKEALGKHPQHEELKMSELKEYETVLIHPDYPDKKVQTGKELPLSLRKDIIKFLSDHLQNFAWCAQDIQGIDPLIAEHSLNIDLTYKPIK